MADLEQKLTSRLADTDSHQEKLAAATKTFDELIEKDEHFASLLSKIKGAYEEYVCDLRGVSNRKEEKTLSDLNEHKMRADSLALQVTELTETVKTKDTTLSEMRTEIDRLKTMLKQASPEQAPKLSRKSMSGSVAESVYLNLTQSA